MESGKVRKVHLLGKSTVIFLLPFLTLILLVRVLPAHSSEEMKVLQMFFKEKDLFSSVTRSPKPVSRIAENITIVTAKEIEAMNAHTLAEVLNRVPGIFVNFNQGVGSFGSTSIFQIEGSLANQVLVTVDGVPWNSLNSGAAETNSIPVGIIDRIEIVKGPASSSWGSSLGGAIHVITKSAGYAAGPTGSVRASYGEHDAQDYRAELAGRTGKTGYYLFGGRQDSDGPDDSRYFENNAFFSRLSYAFSNKMDFGMSVGYNEPDSGLGDFIQSDIESTFEYRNFWGTALFDVYLTRELTFNLRLFGIAQKFTVDNESLGLGFTGAAGELFQKSVYDEQTLGGTAKLVLKKGIHTAVFGADFNRGELEQTIDSGQLLQSIGAPETLRTDPDVEKTGIYVNDTIVLDRWSITPGIRYDYDSTSGSFISPSLGVTYRMGNETILRGSVARGFTAPPLSWTSAGALFLEPNPSLKEESVWSYQVGFESAALQFVWIKGTLFRHEIDDVFEAVPSGEDPSSFDEIFVNGDESRRQGFELQAETLPFHHISLRGAISYVDIDPPDPSGSEEIYSFNTAVVFDDPDLLRAELFGNYIWWNAKNVPNVKYDTYIWDLNLSKRVYKKEKTSADLFLTGHNIFNGSRYLDPENENPDRWFEAGMRVKF